MEVNELNEKNIANIACKVLSIYVIVLGIKQISYLLSISLSGYLSLGFNRGTIIQAIFISILPSIILVAIGLILWIKSKKISSHMICENINLETSTTSINVYELQSAAFSIVGIIILINLIPDVGALISKQAFFSSNYISKETIYRFEIKVSITEMIIRFIIGLLLLFRSKGLVGFIKNLQHAGLEN